MNCKHEYGQQVESLEDLLTYGGFLALGGQRRPFLSGSKGCEFEGGLVFSEDEARDLIRAGYVWRFPIMRVSAPIRSDRLQEVLEALRLAGATAVEVVILATDNPSMEIEHPGHGETEEQ